MFHGGNAPERIGEQPNFYSIRLGKDRRRNFWDHLRNTMARLIWQSCLKRALSTNANVGFMYSCTSSVAVCVYSICLSIHLSIDLSIYLSMLFYSILFHCTLLFILLYSSLLNSIPFYSILIVSYQVVSYRIVSNLSIHLSVCLWLPTYLSHLIGSNLVWSNLICLI